MYPTSLGTLHMRSRYPVPEFVRFFPRYLREAGYYTTNNSKKDYNTIDQPDAWDEPSKTATYMTRPEGQPFSDVFNPSISHESSIPKQLDSLRHTPEQPPLPPSPPQPPETKTHR